MKLLSTLLFCSLITLETFSATFKVGVLAPEGTNWAKAMKKMAKEIKSSTDGKVKLKFYFGGSQGDEGDVLRKIRVGQLHGGIFTGKTLGDINGDVRVIELPFNFGSDRAKAWSVVEKIGPSFNAKFEKAEFKNLGFFEMGMIYFVSQKDTPNLNSLKGVKIWAWEGDKLVEGMIDTMKLISVPLPLPDVLSSLSTGIIQAAYAPPMGMIALQWNTKIKYLVDFPISFSIGAFLLSSKAWKKVSPAHKKIVEAASAKYLKEVNKANIGDNVDALAAMKSLGVKFIKFPEADIKQAKTLRAEMIKKLTGPLFSKEALNKLEGAL